MVVPFENLTVALGARSYVDGRAITFVDEADLDTIANSIDPDDFDNLQSPAFAAAAAVTEFGVSLATDFEVLGRDLTIGVTPKAQTVETYNYAVSVSTFDAADARDAAAAAGGPVARTSACRLMRGAARCKRAERGIPRSDGGAQRWRARPREEDQPASS